MVSSSGKSLLLVNETQVEGLAYCEPPRPPEAHRSHSGWDHTPGCCHGSWAAQFPPLLRKQLLACLLQPQASSTAVTRKGQQDRCFHSKVSLSHLILTGTYRSATEATTEIADVFVPRKKKKKMFSHLLIVILILRHHSGDRFSFHSPRRGFHWKTDLTGEDDRESANDTKIEKCTFQSQQKVKKAKSP